MRGSSAGSWSRPRPRSRPTSWSGPASVLNPFPVAQRAAGEVEIRPFEPRLPYLTSFVVSASTPLPAAGRAFLRHVRLNTAKTPHSELV